MTKGAEKKAVIRLEDVRLRFGGVEALRGVSLEVREGEILAIIGPNGAGKTCVFNCINGFYKPHAGRIYYGDVEITKLRPDKIANMGIARTFQNIQLFTGLSTVDNLMAGRHIRMRNNWIQGALFYGLARKEEVENREFVEKIIDFLELEAVRKEAIGAVPYGLRKRVDLGRALAQEPRVLLLDEPMAGMNAEEKEDIARFVVDIFELRKIPIVLVEHDMGVVMDIADRIVVLNFGEVIAEGSPEEIKANPEVIEAYLGSEEAFEG
ncbi:MAG: ABC transporter ATP-binding protein [Desulfobacterota bacterium]|nr:ABC transporter ATP-binding protein [Thermodesulfobacteriota bacterium]